MDNITIKLGDDETLTLDKGMLVKAKDDNGEEIEGLYTLKDALPALKNGSKVTVSATFKAKSIGMFTGEDSNSKEITLSEYYVAGGDKMTVNPSSDKLKAGYKVTGITVTDENGNAVDTSGVKLENGIASFSVPKDKKDGKGSKIDSQASANVSSKTKLGLMTLSVSAALGLGQTSAGGTVNVIVDSSKSNTTLGDSVQIDVLKNLTIASDVNDYLISGTASASMASSQKQVPVENNDSSEGGDDAEAKPPVQGSSAAGVVNVIVSKSAANTNAGSSILLNAHENDLKLTASNDAWMLNASLAAAANIGQGPATGAAINVNVFNRDAKVSLKDGTLHAGRDLYVQSSGKDNSILAALSLAGGGEGALSGNIGVLVENSKVNTPPPSTEIRSTAITRALKGSPRTAWR